MNNQHTKVPGRTEPAVRGRGTGVGERKTAAEDREEGEKPQAGRKGKNERKGGRGRKIRREERGGRSREGERSLIKIAHPLNSTPPN